MLADAGYGLDLMVSKVGDPGFLSDQWLREWWGQAPDEWVQDELDAIDLMLSERRTR